MEQFSQDLILLINASTAQPGTIFPEELRIEMDEIDQTVRQVIADTAQSPPNDKSILNDTTLAFAATVWLPFFLAHGQHPAHLFAMASSGDFNAMNQLVRMDPLIIHAPAIQKHLVTATRTRQADYNRIMKSATRSSYRKKTAWMIKADLAGLLLATAKVINYPLTKTEAVQLFDAYAHEHHGKREDTDIPRKDQEAYRKQLYRRRDYWGKFVSAAHQRLLAYSAKSLPTTGTKQNP